MCDVDSGTRGLQEELSGILDLESPDLGLREKPGVVTTPTSHDDPGGGENHVVHQVLSQFDEFGHDIAAGTSPLHRPELAIPFARRMDAAISIALAARQWNPGSRELFFS